MDANRCAVVAALVAILLGPAVGRAEGASTATPDLLTLLVSQDVGAERWA